MRKIEYIFIDSDRETRDGKPGRHAVPNLGYHYVVNSEGLVLNPTDVCIPAHIIQGLVYDPDKYQPLFHLHPLLRFHPPGGLAYAVRIQLLHNCGPTSSPATTPG